MKGFLQRWLVTAAGVVVASQVVHGIDFASWLSLAVASLLLGIFNAVLRPILMVLTLPLMLLTLGLFTLVINAILLYLVGWMMAPNFVVRTFGSAFWGGLVISFISIAANMLIGKPDQKRPPPANKPPGPPNIGGGTVIDV